MKPKSACIHVHVRSRGWGGGGGAEEGVELGDGGGDLLQSESQGFLAMSKITPGAKLAHGTHTPFFLLFEMMHTRIRLYTEQLHVKQINKKIQQI